MKTVLSVSLLLIFIISCSPKYATVYISTVDEDTKSNVPMKVYSAKSGLYLGITPFDFDYKKRSRDDNFISIVVVDDCYETDWQIAKLEFWKKKNSKVPNPIEINNLLLEVAKKDSCQ